MRTAWSTAPRPSASRRSCSPSRCARRCGRPPQPSGPTGTSVDLASPATPEAVFWAVEAARPQLARTGGHVLAASNGDHGVVPAQPDGSAPGMQPESERAARAEPRGDTQDATASGSAEPAGARP